MSNLVELQYEYFPDFTRNRPVYNGFIYVGEPDLDPEIPANQKAVTLKGEGFEVVVAQPVRTSPGGVPTYNGSPAQILVDGNYSVKVLDAQLNQVYYIDNAFSGVPITSDTGGGFFVRKFDTLQSALDSGLLDDGDILNIAERSLGNGGGAVWDVVLESSVTVNGFNIVQSVSVPSLALVLREGQNNILQWGAVDGQDSTLAVQSMLDQGVRVDADPGTYLFSSSLTTTTSGQKIKGSGIGVTIFQSSGLASNQAIIESQNFSDIDISGVEFDCNNETYMGIRYTLDNPGQDQLNISAHHCKVFNTLDVVTSLFGGITVDNKQGASFTYQYKGVSIYENVFDTDTATNSGHGCIVAYAQDVRFQNNQVDSAGFHGMEAVGCDGVIESDNTIRNCFESGLGVGSNTKNFIITNNTIHNCDGDGSITVEQNSVQGEVTNNVLTECTNNGINVSFGTAGSAPFNEVNNIIVANNLVMAASSGEGRIGCNAFSSTGAGIGDGVVVKDNIFDGFATGVECTWLSFNQVTGNTVRRFGTVSVGRPNQTFIQITGCDKFIVLSNTCDTQVTEHAIVIDTSLVANSRGIVSDNLIQSATAGALVRKIGNGDVTVTHNKTFGAINFVSCDGTQDVTLGENTGALTGTPITGGVLVNRVEALTVSPEGVIPARIGAMATRSNGGAGTTFYVKESNDGGSTGWVAK